MDIVSAPAELPVDVFAEMRASKPWLDAIASHEKSMSRFHEVCDRVDTLYADLEKSASSNAQREFQIFWSNMEVLKPSIYARAPVPIVSSRFKDRKELPRHASEILERALTTSFDAEDIDATMRLVRNDLATNARGVLWVRYQMVGRGEKVCYDHVDRKDFAHETARKWGEVGWVARRSWLSREQGLARFGTDWLRAEFAVRTEQNDRDDQTDGKQKASVWEVWDRGRGVVAWVSPGIEQVLDIQHPFLTLENFFPCPRPVYGTVERGTLKPVPDFVYYKDQVEEINELTARISALSEALRMKGFYSAGVEELSDAIEAALRKTDNNAILIPVPNTVALGGAALKDSIVWLPVNEVAAVITQLIGLRRQLIDDVYQITGLSDIMRGATNPNETLGAQQLKSQYGSVRVRDRQYELVRLARDVSRIAGEIMAENFQPETLLAMSQYDGVPRQAYIDQQISKIRGRIQAAAAHPQLVAETLANPEAKQQAEALLQQAQVEIGKLQGAATLEKVLGFLRDQRMRPFTLDIETDSTIQPDEYAAKAAMSEFMGALSQALSQLAPMITGHPDSAPFAAEVLKMAVSPFRTGRQLEASIDDFADRMKQAAGKATPDPGRDKAAIEMQKAQAEIARIKAEIDKIQAVTAANIAEQMSSTGTAA